ncbi:Na(+)/H(+) antiporter NhaP [Galdieria sulphuraria]|nr:Na(+)/H(+) antiporter NhaP [Galdieria sulphuraria]
MVNISLYHLDGASIRTCLSPTSTIVVLMSFALGLRWINLRTIRLPSSVMVSFAAIFSAHLAVFFHRLFPELGLKVLIETVSHIQKNFPEFVLRWAIGFLLFGDSLEVDLRNLGKIKDMVAIMAFFSTILSSAFIGYFYYIVALFFQAQLPLATCFLLGAIISPTDPITIMSVLKERTGLVPEFHRVLVMGESLFNDVVGVVLTEGIKTVITENDWIEWNLVIPWRLFWTFLRECIVGICIGLTFGYFVYHLLSCQVEDSILEVGITVAMVGNINLVCYILGASLPLASVTAGLLLGNYGVVFTMSLKTHEGMKWIWNFCTEMLNTLLFILIGFQSLFFSSLTSTKNIFHLLAVIPISLFSRSLSVAIPLLFLGCYSNQLGNGFNIACFIRTVLILTWCGLRGAISIALAISFQHICTRSILQQNDAFSLR